MRHKCDIQSLSYGPLVPSRGWDHQMGIGSIITGAALPAVQAAAGVRAAPGQADAGCPAGSRQGFPEYSRPSYLPVPTSASRNSAASKSGSAPNTEDDYSGLAHTGHCSWQPRSDPHLWLTFNLRAHHMQAQTVARRVDEARQTWGELDVLAQERGLPEWTLDAMFDAVLGYRLRRGGYMKRTGGDRADSHQGPDRTRFRRHPEPGRHRPWPPLHRRRATPNDPGLSTRDAKTAPRPVPVDARKARRAGLRACENGSH